MRSNSSPKRKPSTSVLSKISSSVKRPDTTPEPIIAGANREPSSLVQTEISMGYLVLMP